MESGAQPMRRRGTLLSNVHLAFTKKLLKASAKAQLSPVSPFLGASSESLNFIPNYVIVKVVQATLNSSKTKSDAASVFAKVSIGKGKYETSQIDTGSEFMAWEDEPITLEIPEQGNTAAITVGIYQRKRVIDECLGVTAIFLREFQPSPKERLITSNLHLKYDTEKIVGEVVIAVAFRATADQVSPKCHQASFGGSSKSLNVFTLRETESSGFRRNSSFNKNTELRLSKPIQYVNPVVQVTDTTTDDTTSDDEERFCIRSARGRINSLFELDDRSEEGSVVTLKKSQTSTFSEDEENDDDLPEEFRGKSKSVLVDMILALRDAVNEQDGKINNMQHYIDTRLTTILDANPELLEAIEVSDPVTRNTKFK